MIKFSYKITGFCIRGLFHSPDANRDYRKANRDYRRETGFQDAQNAKNAIYFFC